MKNGPYELIVPPKKYPGKRYRNRYAYEHHVVWWKKHGFVPGQGMEIHHRDGNHRNNRITNLQLVTSAEHRSLHGKMKTIPKELILCDECGKERFDRPSNLAYKRRAGQKYFFCSQKCQAILQWKLGGKFY